MAIINSLLDSKRCLAIYEYTRISLDLGTESGQKVLNLLNRVDILTQYFKLFNSAFLKLNLDPFFTNIFIQLVQKSDNFFSLCDSGPIFHPQAVSPK